MFSGQDVLKWMSRVLLTVQHAPDPLLRPDLCLYVESRTTVGIKAGMGDPLTVRTSTVTTILMLPHYPTLVAVEE
jgi:hypothetical protein